MNQKRFERWMRAVDDRLLEEAAQPLPKKRGGWKLAGAAACFGLICAGALTLAPTLKNDLGAAQPGDSGSAQIANPVQSVTLADITALGYLLPLPEDAQMVEYSLIELGGADGTPMAQAVYTEGGAAYTCRALKTDAPTDISGMYYEWDESLDWSVGTLSLQLRDNGDGEAWIGWYAPAEGTQWCLSGGADRLELLHSAQSIVDNLGYDLAVAPENAEDVYYNAFLLDGLTVGETTFTLDGVNCVFRMASTGEVGEDFADISGDGTAYAQTGAGQVSYCPARFAYDEGGAGKIVWFDVVPGLLYSLRMDEGASESALLALAEQLFVPAQGEVG